MAIDKAVDSSVLDAGLTSVANAIRAKIGGADLLAFPDGMVEAIGGISGGGGESGGGGGGMDITAHSNGATELTMFYGGPASIPALTIKAAFESAVDA